LESLNSISFPLENDLDAQMVEFFNVEYQWKKRKKPRNKKDKRDVTVPQKPTHQ